MAEEQEHEPNGIRVVVVMNCKGGVGKSTIVKGLASAAAARGESVTVFDTDVSGSTIQWMNNAKRLDNWDPNITVIQTMSAETVKETIKEIYSMPDQEHLILIDTFGGGSEAQDEMVQEAHLAIVPTKLSRSDVTETMQTLNWLARLKERVVDASQVPPVKVLINAVPLRPSEAEEVAMDQILRSVSTLTASVMQRAAYLRLDLEGALGPICKNIPNKGIVQYIKAALKEMDDVLTEVDAKIKENANGRA